MRHTKEQQKAIMWLINVFKGNSCFKKVLELKYSRHYYQIYLKVKYISEKRFHYLIYTYNLCLSLTITCILTLFRKKIVLSISFILKYKTLFKTKQNNSNPTNIRLVPLHTDSTCLCIICSQPLGNAYFVFKENI